MAPVPKVNDLECVPEITFTCNMIVMGQLDSWLRVDGDYAARQLNVKLSSSEFTMLCEEVMEGQIISKEYKNYFQFLKEVQFVETADHVSWLQVGSEQFEHDGMAQGLVTPQMVIRRTIMGGLGIEIPSEKREDVINGCVRRGRVAIVGDRFAMTLFPSEIKEKK